MESYQMCTTGMLYFTETDTCSAAGVTVHSALLYV